MFPTSHSRDRNTVLFGTLPRSGSSGGGGSNEQLLGSLISANFNITTDQNITILAGLYRITKIQVTNASVSMTTAAGGIYTLGAKGGVAIVPASQVYTALTSAGVVLSCTIANSTNGVSPLVLSLTTGQGVAATADVYVYGVLVR